MRKPAPRVRPTAADPLRGALPPDSSNFLDGDSATLHPPPAPGTKLPFPSPGAGSLFGPPFAGSGNWDDRGGDGGRTDFPSMAEGTPAPDGDTQNPGGRKSIDVAPIRVDEIQTEVVQKIVDLIDAKVGQRIDELRHETFVSRAAWNALFPR